MNIVYHHRTRGTEAQRIHIIGMVNAFRDLGHSVRIVGLIDAERPPDPTKEADEALWKRIGRRLPFASEVLQLGYNAAALPLLVRRLHRGADLLYERYSLFTFAGVAAARICGVPAVVEVNAPFAVEQHGEKSIRAFRLASWIERRVLNTATLVVAVSTPLRRMLVENGVAPEKVVVAPNGVQPGQLARDGDGASKLRSALGLDGKVVIGFVGWFKGWHSLDLAIEAFARAGLGREAALVLVGEGPVRAGLERRAAECGVGGSVIFTGPIPHTEVERYIDLFDVAVQPAANGYCCPIKLLEYMAGGKAIVAPRQENMEDLLEDGKNALLFAPGDGDALAEALAAVSRRPELRMRLARAAAQTIADRGLLWNRNAERILCAALGRAASQK